MIIMFFLTVMMLAIIIGGMVFAFYALKEMVKQTIHNVKKKDTSVIKDNKDDKIGLDKVELEKMAKYNSVSIITYDRFEKEFGHRKPQGFKEGMRLGDIKREVKADLKRTKKNEKLKKKNEKLKKKSS
ncbi:hypothetical protein ABDK10_05520 [Staphylococcus aureus]